MDSAVAFIILLGCYRVWTQDTGQSVSFSMVFSRGTWLLVDAAEDTAACDKDDDLPHPDKMKGSTFRIGPSVQALSSVPFSPDPGSPRLLVCLLSRLKSPVQDVLWWVDDAPVTSEGAAMSLMRSEEGGAYSAISVWEVSDWRSGSVYWCGTIQEGQVYRQKVCLED